MITLLASNTLDIAAQASDISPISSLGNLIEIGADFVLMIGTLALLVYLLLGAFSWITAGGEKGKIEAAKEKITQGIIGIIVLASVFAIYSLVLNFIGISGRINLSGSGSGGTGGGGGGGGEICKIGDTADDGGAGGYCTLAGKPSSAQVKCTTTKKITYAHWEPEKCLMPGAKQNW